MFDFPLMVVLAVTMQGVKDAPKESAALALRGGKILTATGKTFQPGTLLIQDGKIAAVGPVEAVPIPAGAVVLDTTGKVLIPGLVDSHSHLGVYSRPATPENSDGNEMTGPVQSAVRAIDAINPADPGIRMATAGGITTSNIMPGSGNVIGGQTLYVKLRGKTVEDMRIGFGPTVGGLKMANGENPKRAYGAKGQAPGTRMKTAALQRSEFIKAREYQRKWEEYRKKAAAKEKATAPAVDLALEPLVEVLQKKRTVHFHTHRADDIMTTLRIAKEFDFDLIVQHGTEGYKVARELAERKIPVSMTLPDSPGGKAEVVDYLEQTGAELTKAGVKVLVNTDDPVTESRFLLRTAAIPVRGGLSPETALRSVTIHPAEAMRISERVGSLEPGKDADFVVLSGDPFSVYTRVLQTYIDGKKVFDLSDSEDRLYQTGGFALKPAQAPAAKPVLPPETPPLAPKDLAQSVRPNRSTRNLAIIAGRVHTASKGTIKDGAVAVKDGKITYVGPREGLPITPDMAVLTAASVTPGLIDPLASVPLSGEYNIPADQDSDEKSDPNGTDLRAIDAFNPREPLLRFLLEQGVTVVHAGPGRVNVIGGQTGVFRTHGSTAEEMTVRFPHALMVNLGVQPKTSYPGKLPSTRMGTAALLRVALTGAADYQRKLATAKEDAKPDRNLKSEALTLALDRKIATVFCAQRADDLNTALRLGKEFNLKTVLAMAAEGYLVPDLIAAAKVPVIVHPTMQPVGGLETFNTYLGNASVLSDRGIRISIGSGFESYVPKTRLVRYEAAIAMVHGLGFEAALRSITLDAARTLEIDDRFGSIEVGKVADLVLYDGDPFEYATHVTHVVVDGSLVHDRPSNQGIPFARLAFFSAPEIPCCLGN